MRIVYKSQQIGEGLSRSHARRGSTHGDALRPAARDAERQRLRSHRLVEELDPLGRSTAYAYDPIGNLTGRKDRMGRVIEYGYDAVDRLVTERWLDDEGAQVRQLQFSYDAASNLLEALDADSHHTYTYDALNRLGCGNFDWRALGKIGKLLVFLHGGGGRKYEPA